MEEDGEELELSHLLSSAPEGPFEDLLSRTCHHTHTCNPPGPAAPSHTHTCHHTHLLNNHEEEYDNAPNSKCLSKCLRRPLGNNHLEDDDDDNNAPNSKSLSKRLRRPLGSNHEEDDEYDNAPNSKCLSKWLRRPLGSNHEEEDDNNAPNSKRLSKPLGNNHEEDDDDGDAPNSKRLRRPLGNREAVRKYREKKKAHTAYLEEEVKKLRLVKQQLVRRLQGQPALEAEVIRLRGLLADLRAKIDAQIGGFPYNGQCAAAVGGLQCEVVGWESVGASPAV